MREKFLVFGRPQIGQDEIDEVHAVMESGWLGTGPRTAQFEHDFCSYITSPNAVALNSCTAALHLSALVAGVGPGDEVITTPLTFCATVNALIHVGAIPILADINPITLNIDPTEIEKKITNKTKAIVPVHFAGHPCDMDAIVGIAQRHDLVLIEDCAHAIETLYKGQHVGTFGRFGCFSFYVTKNVVTGEGGMLTASAPQDADRARKLSLHGMSRDAWKRFGSDGYRHYQVEEAGFKYNMMDLQAAIGIHQLARIEGNHARRETIWERYNSAFTGLPVTLPAKIESGNRHAYHLYTMQLDEERSPLKRDAFLDAMTARNIGVGVHYLSLPEHPFYQNSFGWKPEDYPHAMRAGRTIVSLPMSANLTDKDVADVINTVGELLSDSN